MTHNPEVLPGFRLDELRADLIHAATDTITATADYIRAAGLAWSTLDAFIGMLGVVPCTFHGNRFDLDPPGEPAAVIELFGEDVESVLDLVAWPVDRPDRFATAIGDGWGCGMARVECPASYLGGKALRVHRTPLGWLQAGAQGVAILEPRLAPRWLAAAPGPLACEDVDHGRAVARLLHGYFSPHRVLVPLPKRAA